MPKRISRKLLVGLGSIVTFGAVGTVSGFGIKSIIDSSLNNSKLNQLNFNTSDSGTLFDIPNYNVAEEDMFIKTKNLKRFHFGNTQIGQKITPWGWLGVFEDPNVKTRIALTGWNGEIIWVNEDYKALDDLNVYDLQYDFNSNLIFVLRTNSNNGFYNTNNQYPKVFLEVLDAETGQKFTDEVDDDEFELLQEKAMSKLIKQTSLLDGYESNTDLQAKTKNLYYLDITYSPQKKAIMATWMPNYMQMARQTYKDDQEGSLPTFWDVINTWPEVATSFIFDENKLRANQKYSDKKRNFNILNSNKIDPVTTGQGAITDADIWKGQLVGSEKIRASEIFLLTNPFFTTTEDGNAFVMHLIGATLQGRVYHKSIGWKIDLSDHPQKDGELYRYEAGTDLTDKGRFDNIETWSNNGFFKLNPDKSWTKAKEWNKNFINANLRANKNMFDENSIVFAYPYSSNADSAEANMAMPIFNVAQIRLDKSTAQFYKSYNNHQKDNINYDLGTQIVSYYNANKNNYADPSKNNIYPYPSEGNFDENNFNHNYNRLITVSPFDNTIIYAAKPNVRQGIFGTHNKYNRDKWAGFWVVNSWAFQWNKWYRYYHPLIVSNDPSISLASDRYNSDEMKFMLSDVNDLYHDGFTFDIRSLIDSDWRTSLNLYFNQTGSGANISYDNNIDGFQTSKIGLLKDVLFETRSNDPWQPDGIAWVNNVAEPYQGTWDDRAKRFLTATINKDSFSSIIHSRADLTKWYPRTWANANFPSNMLRFKEIFSINNPSLFAVANEFDRKLSGAAFNGKESIDLVTAWKDKNESDAKYNKRFSRLMTQRPVIAAAETSEEDGLGLVTTYKLPDALFRQIVNKQGWEIRTNQANLELTRSQTVPNTSKQILAAWGNAYKMKKIGSTTASLDQTNTVWNEEVNVVAKLDKKDYPNDPNKISFGNDNNNNITRNNATALRLMLKLVKPTENNLPDWFNQLSEEFFNKAYPLEAAYPNETTFKDVVKLFADERAKLIDLSDDKNNNNAVGLGNLKIDAYLELNPKFGGYTVNTDKIYNVPGGKGIVDKNKENQLIIYKDEFRGSRTIYDQSQINYNQFNQGGFGNTTNDSWSSSKDIGDLKNIKVTTNYDNLQNTLVRKIGDNNPLLTFDLKDATGELEITPGNSNWFENHFKNYNRLLGLFVKFEYQKGTDTDTWFELAHTSKVGGNVWTDEQITENLRANNNKLLLTGVPKDIKKLRFRLVKNPDTNDANATIDIQNFQENDKRYISDAFKISIQRISVDKTWISNATLSNASSSLSDISESDVNSFESTVLANIKDTNERQQVKLVYSFENNIDLTAAELVKKLKEKFNNFSGNDQGVFALWDGNGNNGLKIQAKFALKTSNNEFKLVTTSNSNPTDADLSNDIKSTIKSKIDLGDYITQLVGSSIEATMGSQPGEIKADSIKIPAKNGTPGSARFNGKSFEEIKTILTSQGISIKFKQWKNNDWTTEWLELNQITSYATNKPEIQIGFVFDNNTKPTNLELDEGTTEIQNGKSYILKLNLPKIIKAPADQQIVTAYNGNPFSGNTKKLTIDEVKLKTAEQAVLTALKNASGNATDYAGLDAILEFKYKIGDSDFLTAQDLKKYLETKQNDQTSNALKLKFEVKTIPNKDPEFALEETLKVKEFELLSNDNKTIKKWLHGKNFEDELKAKKITVTGSKQNLEYKLGSELTTNFDKASGKYAEKQLILQYQLLDANNGEVQTWTDGYLPSEVKNNVDKIKLRVASDKSILDANKIYVYGPEQENNRVEEIIDLSQIATLIKINPEWFNQDLIVAQKTDISNLTTDMINVWEDKIYQKIPELATDPSLKKKLVIKYEFIRNQNLEAATLANAIQRELTNYEDQTHHGIVKLYDKTVGEKSGYQVKATFEKRDPNDKTIKFVDRTGAAIDGEANKDDRTGIVNTTNITTTIDLSQWINHLMTSLAIVETTEAGKIPAGGLKPKPLDGNPKTTLFAQQLFSTIEGWLDKAQVKFLWTKDETGNRTWVSGTNSVTEYDATKKKLWFALDNQSTNLKLNLGNNLPQLDWNNRDNKNQPITIQLDAPAIINVKPNQLQNIGQHFSGTTKDLKVKTDEITKELNKIKQGLGAGFEQAPLTIMIQVGNESFYDYKNVAQELSKLTDDVENGIVTAKFAIDPKATNQDKFQIIKGGDDNQQIVNDGIIKVFINDKNIFNDLQNTSASGTSKALRLEWQNGITIDETSGVLTTPNPVRGKGLKIEYTFNKNLTGQETSTGSDVNNEWVAKIPKTFTPGVDNNLFIRIRLVDPNKYVYDYINQKITIDLTKIKSIIELNPDWLNQPLSQSEIELENFDISKISAYETSVFNAMATVNNNLKDKIEIRYDFNGQTDIDKNELYKLIQGYKIANANQDNLGILQLWNQSSGEKIVAKFAIKKKHQALYQLEFAAGEASNRKELDGSNIFTTIDFSKVIKWLTETKKLVEVKGDLPNVIFTIPTINTPDDNTFNTKEWSVVESTLKGFGIISQYREILSTNLQPETGWTDKLSEVKKYNENIGKIGIRFKFDKTKSKNIKLKTGSKPNEIFNGKNQEATNPFELSLNIKLNFKIDSAIVDSKFVQKDNVISGNTKFLEISSADEQAMITELTKVNAANNQEFNKAGLVVKYKLDNQVDWKSREQFINDLQTISTDQQTNKVLFKFEVTDNENFIVDSSDRILFDPQTQPDPEQWKVKFFINNGTWENDASKVRVTGTTSGLNWQWKPLGVNDETNNKVGNNKIQIEFSAKETADYNDADATDDPGNLTTGWTRIKPNKIDATTKKLWIRLKAKSGYVYGPAYDKNGQTKTAIAHQVDLKIKREIVVNPTDLLTSLSLTTGKEFVTDITTANLDKFVKDGLATIQPAELQNHVTVKFNFNNRTGLSSQELYQEIQSIIGNNTTPNYGILQLWNGTVGTKIEAYYDLADPDGEYVLITANNSDAKAPQELVTGHIKTKIDLMEIVNDLKTKKIEVESITNKNNRTLVAIKNWVMPNIKAGTAALNGLTWEQFEQRLNDVGVLIEARIVKNPDNNPNDWKPLKDLKQYDDTTLQLALRFKIDQQKGSNIVLSVLNNGDVEGDGNNLNSDEFKMNIKAPATVVVDEKLIQAFTGQDSFTGNTKILNINSQPETELIKAIVDQNTATNADVFKDLKDRLEVQYYLGKNNPDTITDVQWRSAQELKDFLAQQNTDQNTNKIWFRLNLKDPQNTNDPNAQIFQIDKAAKVLTDEQIDAQAKIKIYINETGFTKAIENLKAVGSTDDFKIQGIDEWIKIIPTGLEVWYSNITTPNEDNDNDWNKNKPTTLNTDKKLWVRFKVQDGYEFESARTDKSEYSDKKEINTSGIKVIIKLQTAWLEKIKITGNTKEAKITEDEVIKAIQDAQVLPTDQDDLVELQYNIKGTKEEWLTNDAFITKLSKLAGSKDSNNFILRREELLVRFNIKNKNSSDDYGLNINNQNIDNDNRDNYNVQIFEESKRNNDFEGYINLDHLRDFIKDNFHIVGSTSRPKLVIKNRDQLNTLFAPYVSDNLFDIQFSTIQKTDDSWDWTNSNQSILNAGQLIGEDGLINQNVTIGADKKFAIKFVSKNPKYKVYKQNTKYDSGYVLDLSDNVKITIEITNPFTTAGKTLGIWTRDDSKQGKYFQGDGGFKIVVANKSDFSIDSTGVVQSAQEFLENSALAPNEKQALEFVFHNFGSSAEADEIKRVEKAITNYDDQTWQSFDSIKVKANDDWSREIGLKVGDYLSVAIRVKKEYATQSDPFILKNNDYSMILPVMQDGNNQTKTPGRISGYKIRTDSIKLQKGSIILSNMLASELPPLDGWTELQQLNLAKDDLGNYLGVDLKLQLYSDFYQDAKGDVLISGSGAKLIKRQSGAGIVESGSYTDGAGAPIKDPATGQEIKIYKDEKTKRLSSPIKNTSAPRNKKLDHLGDGVFRLTKITNPKDQALFSLFRNQDIDLKVEASVGQGTSDLPDFYLDSKEEKLLDLKSEISDQIKFLVENEKKISYGWNYDDFGSDKIKYKAPSSVAGKKPEDGFAQIDTKFQLIKKQQGQSSEIITGNTIDDAVKKIKEQLDNDFGGQLKFQISYFNIKGSKQDIDGNNIYQFKELKNKDRIVLKIVAVADDLFYVNQDQPLIINVSGLTQAAPNADKLQYLRVKQGGVIDGQGSFKILVSNPNNPEEDERQILKGWKFMIRVWDKDETPDSKTGKRKIKIDWTDDQARIKNLANGDRVEWKLVSEEGNPVKEAYYNTIALEHKQNSDGTINYQFAQVNYPAGDGTYNIVKNGVGDYPDDENQYPETSGFVISGLKSAVDIFQISKENFAKVMQQLNPTYVGINKQGTIKMEPKYFEDKYWVNSDGELFVKDQQATLKAQDQEQTKKEILLTEFLDNVTFYTHDPVLANYQGGFKFSGNDVNNNNHLTNGDKVWATFDMLNESDENIIINGNEIVSSVTLQLADVSGLKEVIDPMSPLWYVLMALAGVVTLGTAALIAFLMTRHKKLKGK